jgi:site-specific recombinase XerD
MYFGYNLTNLRSFYNFLLFCKKKMQKENKIKQLKETKKKKR